MVSTSDKEDYVNSKGWLGAKVRSCVLSPRTGRLCRAAIVDSPFGRMWVCAGAGILRAWRESSTWFTSEAWEMLSHDAGDPRTGGCICHLPSRSKLSSWASAQVEAGAASGASHLARFAVLYFTRGVLITEGCGKVPLGVA